MKLNIVYLHENTKKVKMTYDSTILPNPGNPAAGQPVDWMIVEPFLYFIVFINSLLLLF